MMLWRCSYSYILIAIEKYFPSESKTQKTKSKKQIVKSKEQTNMKNESPLQFNVFSSSFVDGSRVCFISFQSNNKIFRWYHIRSEYFLLILNLCINSCVKQEGNHQWNKHWFYILLVHEFHLSIFNSYLFVCLFHLWNKCKVFFRHLFSSQLDIGKLWYWFACSVQISNFQN